jgi:hypothetical protein
MLWGALGALKQSYDHLVIDAGSQSDIALAPVAATAPYAVLVGGETPANAVAALAGQLQSAGFAEVVVLTGPPPALELRPLNPPHDSARRAWRDLSTRYFARR